MTAVTLNMNDIFRQNMNNASALNIHLMSTLKMMIVKGTWTPNQNTDDLVTDASGANANEVSGTGYTAGGNACANGSVTMDGAGLVTIDCDDPSAWAQNGAGFSNGRYAVLYDTVTNKILATSANFGADQGNAAGVFSVTIGAAGIFTMAR